MTHSPGRPPPSPCPSPSPRAGPGSPRRSPSPLSCPSSQLQAWVEPVCALLILSPWPTKRHDFFYNMNNKEILYCPDRKSQAVGECERLAQLLGHCGQRV